MSTVALNLAMLARPQREGSSASRGRGCDRGREVAKKRRIIRAPAAAAWGLRRRPLLPVIGRRPGGSDRKRRIRTNKTGAALAAFGRV